MRNSLTLVLGGARSGKSSYAEGLLAGQDAIYIATAEIRDAEMAARREAHQARRGSAWRLREWPRCGAADIAGCGGPVLFDCLTLWLMAALEAEADWEGDVAALAAAMADHPHPVIAVSNEIGMGLVPETALGRAFRDAQGLLNQIVAQKAGRVHFVAAGLPLVLKDAS